MQGLNFDTGTCIVGIKIPGLSLLQNNSVDKKDLSQNLYLTKTILGDSW